jgi:hypothetical protein
MLAPLGAFVVALSSVRTRRSSANVAMLGAVVSLLSTLLVGWGLARKTTAFLSHYPYINLPVAFAGPVKFQGFGSTSRCVSITSRWRRWWSSSSAPSARLRGTR